MIKIDSNEMIKINSNEEIKTSSFNEARVTSHFERMTRSFVKETNINHQSLTSEDVFDKLELRLSRQIEINQNNVENFDEALEYKEKFFKNVKFINALKEDHDKDATQRSDSNNLYWQQTKNSHSNLSWTACYNDFCEVHLNDKIESRWFSKQKSKRRRMTTRQVTKTSFRHKSSERWLHYDFDSSTSTKKKWQKTIFYVEEIFDNEREII